MQQILLLRVAPGLGTACAGTVPAMCWHGETAWAVGGYSMGKGRPKAPPTSTSGWPEHVQLEGSGQLLEAGHLSLHRAGQFAVMGDPRLGSSLEQLCWHTGTGGMGSLVRTWQIRHWIWTTRWELESLGGCRMQCALLTRVYGYWLLHTNHSKECQSPEGAWGYCLPQQHSLASHLSLGSPFTQLLLLWLQMKQHSLPFGSQPHVSC